MMYNEDSSNIEDALCELGYKDIKQVPDKDGDKAPYCLAYKTINLNGKRTNDDVFVYTFATPNTTQDDDRGNSNYDNI